MNAPPASCRSAIAGRVAAGAWLLDQPQRNAAAGLLRPAPHGCRRAVPRAVVDHDDLERPPGLPGDAVQSVDDEMRPVVDRNDDRDQRSRPGAHAPSPIPRVIGTVPRGIDLRLERLPRDAVLPVPDQRVGAEDGGCRMQRGDEPRRAVEEAALKQVALHELRRRPAEDAEAADRALGGGQGVGLQGHVLRALLQPPGEGGVVEVEHPPGELAGRRIPAVDDAALVQHPLETVVAAPRQLRPVPAVPAAVPHRTVQEVVGAPVPEGVEPGRRDRGADLARKLGREPLVAVHVQEPVARGRADAGVPQARVAVRLAHRLRDHAHPRSGLCEQVAGCVGRSVVDHHQLVHAAAQVGDESGDVERLVAGDRDRGQPRARGGRHGRVDRRQGFAKRAHRPQLLPSSARTRRYAGRTARSRWRFSQRRSLPRLGVRAGAARCGLSSSCAA